MGLFRIENFFEPTSVAVIGAGEKPGTIGNALITNLMSGGYQGALLPINPNYKKVYGLKTYPTLSDVSQPVDLAIIATPIATIEPIIDSCIDAKVGGIVIISAGGKEAGEQGEKIEATIIEKTYKAGIRVIGPNCLGLISTRTKLNASFAPQMPQKGNLAFISQSGAICTAILDSAAKENIGFSHFVSIGSMLDVDFGDLIDYLGNDSSVGNILLYVENLTHIRKFMSAARSVSRVKPIIVLKSGRSLAGAKAASSHTGAMAGEDAVYDTAFRRAGIVRVDTIQDLFDCAELTAKQPRPTGSRLAVITNGGGPGVMAADCLSLRGVEPAPLAAETTKQLNSFLPPFWSRNNPIDILGDASADRYSQAINACMESKNFDGIMVIFVPQALTNPLEVAQGFTEALTAKRFPVFTTWMGGSSVEPAVSVMNQKGIPTYDTPEQAVRAFLYMHEYSKNLEMLQVIPPRNSKHLSFDKNTVRTLIKKNLCQQEGFLTETESKQILTAYGISVTQTETTVSLEGATSTAKKLGYPVVMKLVSSDITHKSEANGVQLNLASAHDVERAFDRIMQGAAAHNPNAKIEGVSIQPYIDNPDYELLIGAKKDARFGPVILFGLGGIFTEVLKDRALALPPLNRPLARRLMEETKAFSLLKGYRNRPPADMELLEELLIRLSQLLIDFPEIAELDMNPILVKNGVPCAVDARILLKPSAAHAPHHLIISPYPQEYEFHEVTEEGISIFIRPVKPEDAPLFISFSRALSETSIYYRFFSMIRHFSRTMLIRFTQIDYDREIALVALDKSGEDERILGVARVYIHPDGENGECAVLVGDPWHGKGIGSRLLFRCLAIAKERRLRLVTGMVLKANHHMLSLAKKTGFVIDRSIAGDTCDIKIDLNLFKP